MFFNPDINVFNFNVDNYGSTFTDTGLGVNAPGHANANTKGANTNLLNGVAHDCYALSIMFSGGNTASGIRRQLVDILVDPNAGVGNAGSAWSVLIGNLYGNSPCFGVVGAYGYNYYFPLFIRAGTAIGAAHQNSTATTQALRCSIRAFGKPTRPELIRCGSKVNTLGETTGSTTGVTVTPGTGAMGAYTATLGTLTEGAWWWQLGIGSADTAMTANSYLFELAVGDATNKRTAIQGLPYTVVGSNEQACKGAVGGDSPVLVAASGEDVYVRGLAAAAPDTTMTCIAYAVT